MILESTYTKDWVDNLRKQADYKKADAANIEKMLYAFLMLEKLVDNGLDFVFKGGTALVLLLEIPYRFSIDIDIITDHNRGQLENILNSVIENSLFTHWKLDERRSYKSGVPKAHYKFFYKNSNYGLGNAILLDVLYLKNPYRETVKLPIKSNLLSTQEPYTYVSVPSVNSILGDKLTAFAPNTTGIRYNSGKEIEIIKQLFDVSKLVEQCDDISITKSTFERIAREEIRFRNLDITPDDVINDIFETALTLAKRDKNKEEPQKSQFIELQMGIRNLLNYLIKRNLRIEHAIAASAKIAWFTEMMRQNKYQDYVLYSKDIDLMNIHIKNTSFNFLNRFKKTNKEAFYYWHKCLKLKNELD